jgi:serine/threonine-protein kinase RsbW
LNSSDEERATVKVQDSQTVEVTLPSIIGFERIAMTCSAAFAGLVGLAPERIEDLKTLISEACLNAIEHGNRGREDAKVIVNMNYGDGSFTVSVIDEGVGIQKFPDDPDIGKKIEMLESPRGLGIFLIKQLADKVDFNQMSENGHMVTMVIRTGV